MKQNTEMSDKFPVGLRVLAVDDDPVCLKLLDLLLRKCQYHVTTTNQAVLALKILQENKENFDLVISDVVMPDMDGFKLLELVGLEMDLPVIMLSAYGDTEHVTKGIYHGACDYLVKPVQEKELRLIWKHVMRRNIDKSPAEGKLSEQNGKLNKVRKEPLGQKKPRLSWTPPLHAKFLAAVTHLGLENALPKRIFQIMNEENITKVQVATHLQTYRKYLKKISLVESLKSEYLKKISHDASLQSVSLPTFVGFEKVSGSFPPNITSSSIMQENNYQNSVDPLILQEAPNAMDDRTNYPSFCTQNDCSGYRSNNVEGMISNPEKDITDHGSWSTDMLLSSMIMDMEKRSPIPEPVAGYVHNSSCFVGESSSVNPLLVQQHNENNVPQMMRPNSSFVGTLEDIAPMMNQENDKE